MKHLDTDGSAIKLGEKTWRSKGQEETAYQTPYGEVAHSLKIGAWRKSD